MKEIKIKCPAKLNLSLDVTKKREDGYHELEMIMQTVDVCDYITVSVCDGEGISLCCDKKDVPLNEKNTAYKAAELFFETVGKTKKVDIIIEKHIPQGAGMAGGSADGAGVLKALNLIENNVLSDEELLNLALKIGADVPFCLVGGTKLCKGIGEIMTDVEPMSGVFAIILKPKVSVSTPKVYAALDEEVLWTHPNTEKLLKALETGSYEDFDTFGGNTLEKPVFREFEIIKELKDELKKQGAIFSLMTGSGAAVYGIFDDEKTAECALEKTKNKAEEYFLIKL